MDLVDGDGSRQRLDVVVVRLLVFGDFCCESYMGPSRKLLVSRRRRRWHTVRSDGTGENRGAPPVTGRAGAQSDQLRDPVDLVLLATRKSAFNAWILLQKCP